MSVTDGSFGQQELNTTNNEFNTQQFIIKQALAKMRTCTLVKVVAVDGPIGLSPVGFVDVTPLVNQVDGGGGAVAHTTIHGVPYFRIQGGKNAIVIDPEVDDIGMCMFADSDISSVKASRSVANPGSKRKFDLADGIYFGGWGSKAPERYIWIDDNGITIEGDALIKIHANDIQANCNTAEVNATTVSITATTTHTGNMTIDGNLIVSALITAQDIDITG